MQGHQGDKLRRVALHIEVADQGYVFYEGFQCLVVGKILKLLHSPQKLQHIFTFGYELFIIGVFKLLEQPCLVQHQLDKLSQRQLLLHRGKLVDDRHKVTHAFARAGRKVGRQVGQRREQRNALLIGMLLKHRYSRVADGTLGHIDDTF
ncbi:hypothetical protein SDC9_160536 [bioreactor metagenome]|uniref:Uncharacterized protein n=1 Tax=bioreactor metagenome TaxID=1076179 RepID=A0A645FHW4_9ZZZZ